MICDRAFYGEEMIRFLKAPDSLMSKGTLLKDGNTATVALVQVGGRPLVVKRYNIKGLGHLLRRGLRTSRAHISWRNAHLLRILGIPTPGPVAILEQRRGPFRLKSYFVMEYVEGENARSLFRMKRPDTDRNKLITRIVGLIQMLSNASISHGDFKATIPV